ncbi:protease do-like 1 [Bacillus sp. OxB-1]|uniref:hypothetical protein n=1 Tax=Bacillus sp. (strain OxB-1) TaxID=98228 RepID=UPI00058216E9|nr:hypothetical protein [Bacillus sp. OxB-1]BAQ10007.1 protease do-like 1 [Bacillus sp. OxB-1]
MKCSHCGSENIGQGKCRDCDHSIVFKLRKDHPIALYAIVALLVVAGMVIVMVMSFNVPEEDIAVEQ